MPLPAVVNTPMRAVEDIRRGASVREVPEESLTLTGDEKIVDVDFSLFWKSGRATSATISSTSRIPKEP